MVEYCQIEYFSDNTTKSERAVKSPAYLLVDEGVIGTYEPYISFCNVIEIWRHFTDSFLMDRARQNGYGFKEFWRVRQEYTLTEDQAIALSQLVDRLRASKRLTYVDYGPITDREFKAIMEYTKGCLDFMDALHLRLAIAVGCDYFVTNDGELRKRTQDLMSKGTIAEPIKVTSAKGFLGVIGIGRKLQSQVPRVRPRDFKGNLKELEDT